MRFLILLLLAATAHADYIKIANDGSQLPESAQLGSGAKDWACTYDSGTGLLWEVKSPDRSSQRAYQSTFGWNSASSFCNGVASCLVNNYVYAVNSQKLCGTNDWRVPKTQELTGLIYCGTGEKTNPRYCSSVEDAPSISNEHFPYTPAYFFWTIDITKATTVITNSVPASVAGTHVSVDFSRGSISDPTPAVVTSAMLRLVSNHRPVLINQAQFNFDSGELILTPVDAGGSKWNAKLQQQPDGSFKVISVQPQQ